MSQSQKRQIKLELPKDPSATYANMVMIGHTQNEVIFDFIQVIPNDPRARVQKRIVMTPAHAKMFLRALDENIRRFENKHGEIEIPARPQSLADQLFRNINPATGEATETDTDDDEEEDN